MRQRFRQEELGNVKPLRSSLWILPFADSSFDVVAMNGVLEWVATGQSGDPREIQERALKNAFRLLRPGGCFTWESRTAMLWGTSSATRIPIAAYRGSPFFPGDWRTGIRGAPGRKTGTAIISIRAPATEVVGAGRL